MAAPGTWDGDVVIVGGGIAGSALAVVLARAGVDVCVLEREPYYRDRVRGEIFVSWGVAELQRLGLDRLLLDTPGGSYTTRGVLYDEIAYGETADEASLAGILPEVPGHLAVGHVEACTALAAAARASGATMHTGVGAVELCPSPPPSVRFEAGGRSRRARARLVVGADGTGSSVRRQLRLPLSVEASGITGCGLLVRDIDGWPHDQLAVGTEGDLHFQVFPRAGGYARLYLYHDRGQRRRFAGDGAAERFLRSFELRAVPDSERIVKAAPAGPCRSYGMSHSWTPRPYAGSVVLVGDAAGWSDPIIGQGLSVAARDVRLVADALLAGDGWPPAALAAYARERTERMRRLRMSARLRTAIHCTFTAAGVRRRRHWYERWHGEPILGGLELAMLVGPDRVTGAAFTSSSLAEALAPTR